MQHKLNLITVISFCTVLFLLAALFVILPDRSFSEQENRSLAAFPIPDADSFFSGEYASRINVYFADQFPFRDWLVKLKSTAELLFAKNENNGVLYHPDQLAVRDFNTYKSRLHIAEDTDRIYLDTVRAQLELYDTFAQSLDVPLVTVLPPRTIDVTDSLYSYDRPDGDAVFELMSGCLSDKCGYIDTLSLIRDYFDRDEYVMYRTDHHWTTYGAYLVYCEIMKQLGKESSVIPYDSFEIECINDFSGTTASRANFPSYRKDTLEIWHLPDDQAYSVVADGVELGGFYSTDYLSTGDKYSVFLDGTHQLTEIKKIGENRETLLIAKDSFANCLIPFLAREYDIVAVNLHTYTGVSALAEQYHAAAVLVVYNTENIITTPDLGNLK